jgi:hypothetical protein
MSAALFCTLLGTLAILYTSSCCLPLTAHRTLATYSQRVACTFYGRPSVYLRSHNPKNVNRAGASFDQFQFQKLGGSGSAVLGEHSMDQRRCWFSTESTKSIRRGDGRWAKIRKLGAYYSFMIDTKRLGASWHKSVCFPAGPLEPPRQVRHLKPERGSSRS